ncbi:hypothetical protein CVT25_014181, partial [Psilocybe cyanescens]
TIIWDTLSNLKNDYTLIFKYRIKTPTLVYIFSKWAVEYHPKKSIHQSNLQHGVRAMVFGDYMPTFSRALLQGGQLYYLTTISTGLLVLVILFITSIQSTFKVTFLLSNIMLMNIIPCHIFRKTKFGIFPENVSIWDILSNVKNEYALLFRYRIKVTTVVYMVARSAFANGRFLLGSLLTSRRLSTLAFILVATIFSTAPIKACNQFVLAVHILMTISISTTSLLFVFRVRAIYEGNKYIASFFGLMWLAVVASFIVTMQGLEAHLESNEYGSLTYCATRSISRYIALDFVMPLVHDTLVFLAISWRLTTNSIQHSNVKNGVRAMVFGDYMPAFSRALLQDGQMYYLTTISTGLLAFVMLFMTGVEVTYKTTFLVPNIMLMNIMACYVFRKTKFGIFAENGISTINPPTLPLAFDIRTTSTPYIIPP